MERLAGMENCAYLKYCIEHIKILSEEEWRMMVSLLVRCGKNGRELATEFSQGVSLNGRNINGEKLTNIINQHPFTGRKIILI